MNGVFLNGAGKAELAKKKKKKKEAAISLRVCDLTTKD